MRIQDHALRWWRGSCAGAFIGLLAISTVRAQEPVVSEPVVPAPATPRTAREIELEQRVQQLESLVNELSQRMDTMAPTAGTTLAPPSASVPAAGAGADAAGPVLGGSAGYEGPTAPAPSPRFDMPAPVPSFPGKVRFGPGFEIMTDDEEFQFQFHDLTQVDYRGVWDTARNTLNPDLQSTFGIPRQWWIFSGRLTKPFEYYVVPSFGFDNVNLLDAFLNVHYDDRLQLKIGRYKTPFAYEFYSLPVNALVSPERSLFFNNFGLNRDVGIMAWGKMFKNRFDYAVGIFNGSRNFYIDRNNSKDLAALINFRPFHEWKDSPLENLNFGGSVLYGDEFSMPVPQILRTNVATTGSSFFGVPFLAFNDGVIESGEHALWDMHAAWYYHSLSLLAEWGSGFQDYAQKATPGLRTHLPVSGYYVQAGYFLTGEWVESRGVVKPFHDFDIRHGKFGLGAMELSARYSELHLSNQVFTAGLADPTLWSNFAYTIDVGVNWYLTQYIKVYLGWQHAEFGRPVQLDATQLQLTNDMLWSRFQIYF